MVVVTLEGLSPEGGFSGESFSLSVSGHADFSAKGSDIVCAAVSVLYQTLQRALVEIAGAAIEIQDERDLKRTVLRDIQRCPESVPVIIQTVVTGLSAVAASYPDNCRIITSRR